MATKNPKPQPVTNEKEDSPSSSTASGGSKPVIQIENKKVDVPPPESEVLTEEEAEAEQHPETEAVNRALVETATKTIGKLLELLTKIDEMNFTDDEVEQLTNLWTPFVPPMTPLTVALLGTGVILTGKMTIYMSMRKKGVSKNAESAAKEQSGAVPPVTAPPAPDLKT